MKSYKLFLILLFLPISVFSQYISVSDTICADESIFYQYLTIYQDEKGNDFVFFKSITKTAPIQSLINVQKFNSLGKPQWPNCGIPLKELDINDFSAFDREKIQVISDKNGGIFMFTSIDVNRVGGAGELWGQKIDTNGNLSWGVNGKTFDSGKFLLRVIDINISTDNNISLLWEWGSPTKTINFQRISPVDGNTIFNNTILIGTNSIIYSTYLLKDSFQNEYIITTTETETDDKIINHIKVNSEGLLTSKIISNLGGPTSFIYPVGNKKYLFVRKIDNNQLRTFFNILNDDGSFVLSTSKEIMNTGFFAGKFYFGSDGNHIYIFHKKFSNSYIQKIDLLGNILWGVEGKTITDYQFSSPYFNVCSNGGVNVVYNVENTLEYQYFDASGIPQFNNSIILSSPHNSPPLIIPTANSSCGLNLYKRNGLSFTFSRQQIAPDVEKCVPFEIRKTK